MRVKRNVSVCRGHELANALYLWIWLKFRLIQFENVLRVIWQSKHCEQLKKIVRPLINLKEELTNAKKFSASILALLCDSTRSGLWSQPLRGGTDKLSPKEQM